MIDLIAKCWICGTSTLNKTEEEFDILPFWCSEDHEKQWREKVKPKEIPEEEFDQKSENGKVYHISEEEENEEEHDGYNCPHERNCKAHREICMSQFGYSEITQRK